MQAFNAIFCCAGEALCCWFRGLNGKLFSRIGFITLSLIFGLLSMTFSAVVPTLFMPFKDYIQCPGDYNLDCLGISSVYRMSFGLLLMHFLVIIFSLFGKTCFNYVNQGCWLLKIILVFSFFIGGLFVPNRIFIYYSHVARYSSIAFLLYQTILTINFGHVLNIKLFQGVVDSEEKGKSGCIFKTSLIVFSIFFFGTTIIFIVHTFLTFKFSLINLFLLSGTFIFGVLLTILSISPLVKNKRLLTSLYVFSYNMYLAWSAINLRPNQEKNGKPSPGESSTEATKNVLDMGIGLIYVAMTLSYLGFFIRKSKMTLDEDLLLERCWVLEKEDENPQEVPVATEEDGEETINIMTMYEPSLQHFLFHIYMMFLSLYYSMLFTNWTIVDLNLEGGYYVSKIGFWVKLGLVFATFLSYLWALIAPKLFPTKNFGF